MYRLMLVDDESEIREGLREVVDFESLGFEVVGEAANGISGLQMAEALSPDLIITDIRMPLMNGMTMCRQIRDSLPTAQFIVLSGYDEFEYARQAIEVKALGYLLKPISSAEFVQMLREAKKSLDKAAQERADISRLRQRFQTSLPFLRESLLASLVSGGISPQDALRHAERYNETLTAPAYALLMARVGEETGEEKVSDPELLPFAVSNIMDEVLNNYTKTHIFRYNSMTAGLLLLENDSREYFSQTMDHIEEARKIARYYLQCELHVGVSTACRDLATLPAAARQAMNALEYSLLSGTEHALCIQDVERGSSTDLVMDDYQLRRLSNLIKAGESDAARELLLEIISRCRLTKPAIKAYQTYLMELLMGFLRIVPDMSLEREHFDEDFDRISGAVLATAPPVDEAAELFLSLMEKLISSISESRRSSGRLIADAAQSYLDQNYMRENLSLEDLCLHLHVSPSYFSSVFKKETKKTFHQHLTELRMDRALTLLSAGELRTAQVAREVGLPDPSYFSYCFKKHFGFTPGQARKNA